MKKIIFLAVSLVVILSLSGLGCGNKNNSADNSTQKEEEKITNINDAMAEILRIRFLTEHIFTTGKAAKPKDLKCRKLASMS